MLLLGAGEEQKFDGAKLRTFVASALRAALGAQVRTVALVLPRDHADARTVGEGVGLGCYRFTKYFTGDRKPKTEIGKVVVFGAGKSAAADKRAADLGLRIAGAVGLARDAVNEPPNELYPEVLAQIARRIARDNKLKIKVLDKKGILAAGMRLHYAVGQGSSNDPRFIHLSYVPRRKKKKLVFVGKGLTFDSGGLCIKPAPGMGEMKSDMAGAAAVLGLMAAVAEVKPDVEVHGVIVGAAENMPDGTAYRPGRRLHLARRQDRGDHQHRRGGAAGAGRRADLRGPPQAGRHHRRGHPDGRVRSWRSASLAPAFYATDDELASWRRERGREAGRVVLAHAPARRAGRAARRATWPISSTPAIATAARSRPRCSCASSSASLPWIHCDIAGPVLAERARGLYPKGGTGHAVLTFLRLVEQAAR